MQTCQVPNRHYLFHAKWRKSGIETALIDYQSTKRFDRPLLLWMGAVIR